MGIIKVETPQGIVDVEIEGEEPTQEEQTALYNTFFSGGREAQVKTDIDLATASFEEVQEYVKQREALGIDPATGEKIEKDPTEEVGVDYVSGLRNFRIRAGLANKETTEERFQLIRVQEHEIKTQFKNTKYKDDLKKDEIHNELSRSIHELREIVLHALYDLVYNENNQVYIENL